MTVAGQPPVHAGSTTIAVAGCGCVGGALLDLIAARHTREPQARRIVVDRVLVRRRTGRRRPIPDGAALVTRADAFLESDAAIVVEALGGVEPALRIARAALARGATLVTANKTLIARHGAELLRTAETTGAQLLFEGAVGGGIPVVRTLRHGFTGTRIRRITGILNGTSNYILSRMQAGNTFAAALERAQRLGYAEADPGRDLDGRDAADKIRILAWLAWSIDPRSISVHTTGLGKDPDALVRRAKAEETIVRLIAECRMDDDGAVSASVRPDRLPPGSAFAGTAGAGNRIRIETDGTGDYEFSGPGAGGAETAAAMLADILTVAG